VTTSFTCPDCGAVSYHPDDVRYRYCGRCRDFKGETDWQEVASRTHEDHAAIVRLSTERPSREKERPK
jgi:ribosomal protein S27AE